MPRFTRDFGASVVTRGFEMKPNVGRVALRGRRNAAIAERAARRGCWRRARRWRSGPGCVRGGRGRAAGGVGRVEGAWVWWGAGHGRSASGRDGDRSAAECRDSQATSVPWWCRAGSGRIPTWVGSLNVGRVAVVSRGFEMNLNVGRVVQRLPVGSTKNSRWVGSLLRRLGGVARVRDETQRGSGRSNRPDRLYGRDRSGSRRGTPDGYDRLYGRDNSSRLYGRDNRFASLLNPRIASTTSNSGGSVLTVGRAERESPHVIEYHPDRLTRSADSYARPSLPTVGFKMEPLRTPKLAFIHNHLGRHRRSVGGRDTHFCNVRLGQFLGEDEALGRR